MIANRIMQLHAASEKGFADAVTQGVELVSAQVRHIRSASIKKQRVRVVNGRIREYHVDLEVGYE